ncbi:HTH-type transcriptional repressor AllR [Corynebacterium capitovis DSM 44611]|uniref:IclR family transcriptional regulator n=1 Tax=Corynebacterium capitovis TaxID=131081 RepID=UPI000477D561|nr:IclR family transcriptional regulator [Corynebacterium capitovis]WKD57775.1 HTH-type transcriptional repressor AllR [Corynebacterium capitovis DSM 44611]
MRQYSEDSGIKVLDRAVAIVRSVAAGSKTLAALSEDTGLPRATTHRIATALEVHHVLARTPGGEWTVGAALARFSSSTPPRLLTAAEPVMRDLVELTGESTQLYELTGTTRTCIAAHEPPSGLTYTVPVGSQLTLTAGSAARVFAAFSLIDATAFPSHELDQVRETGVAESVAEREVGLASVSAPVLGTDGALVAVLSISGPVERLSPSPAATWGEQLHAAAERLSQAVKG